MGPELLGRLVSEHAAALVLYARQWCDAPEDVVQEAFVKLISQRQPPERVLPWLYRVVRDDLTLNRPPLPVSPVQTRSAPLPLRLHYLLAPMTPHNQPDAPETESSDSTRRANSASRLCASSPKSTRSGSISGIGSTVS